MKRLKKIVVLLTLAAVCFTVPGFGKLTAKAAANTYVMNFRSDKGDWYFEPASSWSENIEDRNIYYLAEQIKDGDTVVVEDVDGNGHSKPLKLSVRLGNLTIKSSNDEAVVVYANGYDSVYVLTDTAAAINGDVSHAYVYNNAKVNFNNNVDTLEMIGTTGESLNNLHATITCVGTVNHLTARDNRDQSIYYDFYNFAANKLVTEDGALRTEAKDYSTAAPVSNESTVPAVDTQVDAVQPTQNTNVSQNTSASSAYDDVPKTGESSMIFWLLGTAVVCIAGGCIVRKKNVL